MKVEKKPLNTLHCHILIHRQNCVVLNASNAIANALQRQQVKSDRMQNVLEDFVHRVAPPAPKNVVCLPEMLDKTTIFDGKDENVFQEWSDVINRATVNTGWTNEQKIRVAVSSLRGVTV